MEDVSAGRTELKYDQKVFMVIGGQGERSQMLIEDDNLIVFESLWHAGPLVHDLQTLGFTARAVPMLLYALYSLAQGMDLGLWVMRHDGTIMAVEEIVFL
ncbi:MAG TPA: hypothetical protein ENN19_01720 [Chloroflexi bacterium]|nr:hypothetical protein [Chloroflexota bacterium]